MKIDQELIEVGVTLPVAPERVWQALTDPAEMPRWFFPEISAFEPTVGARTSFVVVSGGRSFDHRWKVLEAQPGKSLVLGWRYQGHAGNSRVAFDLGAGGQGTRLRVTHTVTEDFPDGVPEFTREACHGGWVYFLQERLPAFLAG